MMDGDRSSQDKYTLPVEFEELLDQRNFTYVSISSGMSGELHNFVLVLQNRSDDQTIIRIVVHDGNFAHSRTNDIT